MSSFKGASVRNGPWQAKMKRERVCVCNPRDRFFVPGTISVIDVNKVIWVDPWIQ
jgi:hypothetical protein